MIRSLLLIAGVLALASVIACTGDASGPMPAESTPDPVLSGGGEHVVGDEPFPLAEGEFIDTRPIRGAQTGGLLILPPGGFPGLVAAAEAVVLADLIEVADVTTPIQPAPPNVPAEVIQGTPVTTYRASVAQWLKGDGNEEILIGQSGAITPAGPVFTDGDFLLQPGRRYVLLLTTLPFSPPGPGELFPVALGRSMFEVTDGFVHVLNNPITTDLQEQYGGFPLAAFQGW